ncbi:MAG TPA: flagellar FliJ family protein [Verrucomicrobiae bacterium]|jgi:flagellar export protein FliJ|nr:flagellar FliJ family protein [Verrucomicrobiae bacterium]
MKAFRFTLEAVHTLRLRQENDALEQYSRALLIRQQALAALETVRDRIQANWVEMRQLLAGLCAAAQMRQLQDFHRALEQRQQECVAALRAAERSVHAASQNMLLARQQREIVDSYRDKQIARHQRAEAREEQKVIDEFAGRRSPLLNLSPS